MKGKDVLEKRFSTEFRFEVEKRTVAGVAIPWSPAIGLGDYGREKMERGAFGDPASFRPFNLTRMHQRAVPVAANIKFEDTEKGLTLEARIANTSAGDEILREISEGLITGFSTEFYSQRETRRGGIRVITKAMLGGVSLVDFAAYQDATIQEVRQKEIAFQDLQRKRKLLLTL